MSQQKETIKMEMPFMGVSINENGPQNLMVLKALAHPSSTVLGIDKFIEITGFKLNMVMFDYFWQVMIGDTRSYLGSRVLQWFGYEGDDRTQKKKIY